MTKSVCIINAHPDPSSERFVHAICDAADAGAREAGHTVSRIDIGKLSIPMLSGADEFALPPAEPVLSERVKIAEADHLFLAFPLWLGSMPAKARAFFEQAARADFFLQTGGDEHGWPAQFMQGKSARIVVTMGMPSLIYRFGMDAGAVKALERALLGMSGFKPVHHTILGGIESRTDAERAKILADMKDLGARAT
ncbi:MAG: NAD(P)H-dependent oxidoreductase [Pseudomonadota bacterium]